MSATRRIPFKPAESPAKMPKVDSKKTKKTEDAENLSPLMDYHEAALFSKAVVRKDAVDYDTHLKLKTAIEKLDAIIDREIGEELTKIQDESAAIVEKITTANAGLDQADLDAALSKNKRLNELTKEEKELLTSRFIGKEMPGPIYLNPKRVEFKTGPIQVEYRGKTWYVPSLNEAISRLVELKIISH